MRITGAQIGNFRCLQHVRIDCDPLTVLIGANGTGKSTVFRALQFFFGDLQLEDADCWARDPDLTVRVELTFTDIPEAWRDRLDPWLQDDALVLARESTPADGGRSTRYVSYRRQHPAFRKVREANSAADAKAAYQELRAQEELDLPGWQSRPKAEEALDAWETEHPDHLEYSADDTLSIGGGDPTTWAL